MEKSLVADAHRFCSDRPSGWRSPPNSPSVDPTGQLTSPVLLPVQPVANNLGQRSMNYGLLRGTVACFLGLLGLPKKELCPLRSPSLAKVAVLGTTAC